MTSLKSYLTADALLELGVVQYRRTDGSYAVNIRGRTRIARSSLADIAPGQQVVISRVNGRWYITENMSKFGNTNTMTVVANV